MKKIFPVSVSTFFIATTLLGQVKVAAYPVGKPGTDKYESLSFWTKDLKPTEIHYVYGTKSQQRIETGSLQA
jgi:hypothetical protein